MGNYKFMRGAKLATTAVIFAAAAVFVSKATLGERIAAMGAMPDTTGLADYNSRTAADFRKMCGYGALTSNWMREEGALGQPAGNASALDALYERVNKYADLGSKERAGLEKDVMASGDAGLIDYYNGVKASYSGKPVTEKSTAIEQPAGEVEKGQAEVALASKTATDIDGLYGQANRYADLTGDERAGLEKDVMASGDAGLIDYYNGVKASYSGKPAVEKPAGAGVEVKVPRRIEERIGEKTPKEKQEERMKSVEETVGALYKEGVENPEVLEAVAPIGMRALKDSLNAAVNECYGAMNAMAPKTLAQDSARIAEAIAGIEKVMRNRFPAGDSWVEYTLLQLKEYFEGSCEAMARRN